MPRKLNYEERMAKALREQQAVEARLNKLALAKKKAENDRLLGIERSTRLLQFDDEVIVPELRQLVARLLSSNAGQTEEVQHG